MHHNQLNNSNLNNSLAAVNQHLISDSNGIVYRVQGTPAYANGQLYAQGPTFLLQRNGLPSSSNVNTSFSFSRDLPAQPRFDLLLDNTNIYNQELFSIIRPPLNNYPRLTELPMFNNTQGVNVVVPRAEPLLEERSYVDSTRNVQPGRIEFRMSNEDFPELPQLSRNNSNATAHAQWATKSSNGMAKNSIKNKTKPFIASQSGGRPDVIIGTPDITDPKSIVNSLCDTLRATTISQTQPDTNSNDQTTEPKPKVETFPDGKVINIPEGVIRDQFGLIGEVIAMKMAETDPSLVNLNFGEDLTELGLNLNSTKSILHTFAGPFANNPLPPQDIDPESEFEPVPEYKISHKIGHKLAPFNISVYKEDLLFYLFYTFPQSNIQLKAAQELRIRGWRYHIESRVWIIRKPGTDIIERTELFERGTFYVFDVQSWRKVVTSTVVEYSKLEQVTESNSADIPFDTTLDRAWIESIGFSRRNC